MKKKQKKRKRQPHLAVQPPSIITELPVIIEDASEARKVTADATSLTVTTLLIGVLSLTYLLYFLYLIQERSNWIGLR